MTKKSPSSKSFPSAFSKTLLSYRDKHKAQAPTLQTYEGAAAYSFQQDHPWIQLVFTMGSALFTDGFYETKAEQILRFADLLLSSAKVDPRFAWQYAAWIRDPRGGKGNRIQGTLALAVLDGLLDPSGLTRPYVAYVLQYRPDDALTFFRHFQVLRLGKPSKEALLGMADALCTFDEYSLMKYAAQSEELRLADLLSILRPQLESLGKRASLALSVASYLRATSRNRRQASILAGLPLTAKRKELFSLPKEAVKRPGFAELLGEARVTWEQAFSHFGYDHALGVDIAANQAERRSLRSKLFPADFSRSRRSAKARPPQASSAQPKQAFGLSKGQVQQHNRCLWSALLATPGLLPDLAFLRNLRNLHDCGFSDRDLIEMIQKRKFSALWPHQIYAAFQQEPQLEPLWSAVFRTITAKLPSGRHLGIGDASGSMSVAIGGLKGSLQAVDLAFCFVGLMSETSGLGASFSDNSWFGSVSSYLSIGVRPEGEGGLLFSTRPAIRAGMGGTQVFGAVIELIAWLHAHPEIAPPEVLWFFSDMQFHPSSGALRQLPSPLRATAERLGLSLEDKPPLESALALYRSAVGPVHVVLWNLAAYAPIPVPADIPGVLLLSGFDAQNFAFVERWRKDPSCSFQTAAESQEIIFETIRSYRPEEGDLFGGSAPKPPQGNGVPLTPGSSSEPS